MRKILILSVVFVITMFQVVNAGWYLTLGDDYAFLGPNTAFGFESDIKGVMNGGAGYFWENGLGVGVRYDHFGLEDYEVGSENARLVAPVISVGLDYMLQFADEKISWVSALNAGMAMMRYRVNISEGRAMEFTPSVTTALYYQVVGQFSLGLEAGYRLLKRKDFFASDIVPACVDCGPTVDLGGFFIGLSMIHLYK